VKLTNSSNIRFRNVHVNAKAAFRQLRRQWLRHLSAREQISVRERDRRFDRRAGSARARVRSVSMSVRCRLSVTGAGRRLARGPEAGRRLLFHRRRQRWMPGASSISSTGSSSASMAGRKRGPVDRADAPLDAVNLAVDRSGHLLVLSSAGHDASVYSIDPAKPAEVRTIAPTPAKAARCARVALPGNMWAMASSRPIDPTDLFPAARRLLHPLDGSRPTAREYVSRTDRWSCPPSASGIRGPMIIGAGAGRTRSTPMAWVAAQGGRAGLLSPTARRTAPIAGWSAVDGTATDLRIVADRGGESAARGVDGTLYVANGAGVRLRRDRKAAPAHRRPERPLQLVIGGEDGHTLFVLTHHALYATQI
jgi:hypothetical protein